MSSLRARHTPIALFAMVVIAVLALVVSMMASSSKASASTGGSISGQVFLGDATHPAGTGEVQVLLAPRSPRIFDPLNTPSPVAVTDSSGRYSIPNVADGNYQLLFHDVGSGVFADIWWGGAIDQLSAAAVTVSGSDVSAGATLPLGGSISGTITTMEGVLASATVVLYPTDAPFVRSGLRVATSAADGTYSVGDLAPGQYEVEFIDTRFAGDGAKVAQYFDEVPDNIYGDPVPVSAGVDTPLGTYRLLDVGRVSAGFSCIGCNPGNIISFFLDTRSSANSQWVPVQNRDEEIDSSLQYTFSTVFPGEYRIRVSAPNCPEVTSSTVDLPEGQQINTSDVILKCLFPPSGVQPASVSFVRALYNDYLNRDPSQSEATFWATGLDHGAPRSNVASGFVNSDEYRLIRIDAAYQLILDRTAEQSGRNSWLNGMKAGTLTTDDIEQALFDSDEFFNLQGGTTETFVKALYVDLLHRSASDSEWQGWAVQVDDGQLSRSDLVGLFWRSLETARERVSLMYASYLGRPADDNGVVAWGDYNLKYGDSAVRSALTSSDEYYARAQRRYPEVS